MAMTRPVRYETYRDMASGEDRTVMKVKNPVTGVWEEKPMTPLPAKTRFSDEEIKDMINYKPDETRFTDKLPPQPAMYNQQYVDTLKDEVEHWKRLYRQQLMATQDLMKLTEKGG